MNAKDLDDEDCITIAGKIVEMADRVRVLDLACPGAVASWAFEMDGVRYVVKVAIDQQSKGGEL